MICFYEKILTGKKTAYAFFARVIFVEEPTSESLVATSLHVFSKGLIFFFFPFFTRFFFDFQLYIAALCCIRVGFEKKPQAISGCGDRGDQSKESSMTYLTQCWGAGGEGAGFETHSPVKYFPVGVVFSTPHSHGTAISHSVVCQEAKMALLFSAELQWRVPRGVKIV